VAPSRIALLATICTVIMCCAGAVQLLGINRIVVTDGQIPAAVAIDFRSDYFPLER
jgi:hypothetical protein